MDAASVEPNGSAQRFGTPLADDQEGVGHEAHEAPDAEHNGIRSTAVQQPPYPHDRTNGSLWEGVSSAQVRNHRIVHLAALEPSARLSAV